MGTWYEIPQTVTIEYSIQNTTGISIYETVMENWNWIIVPDNDGAIYLNNSICLDNINYPTFPNNVNDDKPLWKNGLDWFTLLSINRLEKANDISLGQRVKIPNQRGILHVLNEGETLEDVALNYDVNIRKIIRVNRILDPDNIKKGTDIFVPGAKVTQAFGNELMKTSGIPPQFAWPCRRCRLSSRFGYRKDPFTGRRAFHSGIDLASGYGARVNASMDGVVTYAGWMGGYGKLVVIRHSGNYTTRYGHLSSILVRRNRRVRQGQRIGYVGNTGRSKGPHLHFEVRQSGKPLNPIKIIR